MAFDYPFPDCVPVFVVAVEPSDRMTVDFDINEVQIEPLIPYRSSLASFDVKYTMLYGE